MSYDLYLAVDTKNGVAEPLWKDMAKKIIQRYLPDPKTIKEHRSLRFLGKTLHNTNLWQLNRRSAAMAFAVGIFVAFIPMPFQMVLAAVLAVLFSCNMPLSVALVWITNPVTMPAIFYFTYKVGCFVLDTPVSSFGFDLQFDHFSAELARIWKPLYLGSVLCGSIFSVVGYTVIRAAWRWNVIHNWRQRPHRYKTKS